MSLNSWGSHRVGFIFREDSGILIPGSVFRRNKPCQERQGSYIPGVAHHVIQRGHNRQVVFAIEEDFQCHLANLVERKNAFGVKLYAYCLMTNHVHLLLVPARPKGLALLLKHLAAR